ncbi:hypothetical protein HYD_7080 [Candidatus Hydrogenosomobacter endosymbioticus]|uniref:diaminopimelate epimerase n=2 Tax=Candidatus Hydrogenosomobacter endosymbioticus TaxID=2558174 RepID=A0ABN6L8Q6_9PROT|nr:hypothetical protein HYD_7080 [Candidatus Hydrogenosomobacter endosymbioticus]
MHVWNNDGSKARFCGNGARCAAAYISKKIKSIGKSSSTDTPPSFQKNSLKKEQTIKEEANIVSIVSGTIQVECKILDPWIVDVRQPFPMVRHAITKEGIIKPCESIELENGALAIPVFALNQHAVVMNKRPENRPISEQRLEEIAQSLQCHQMFPEGTNVSITSFDSKNCLAMTEVWERGVGATSACGSAACAVGASIFDIYKISSQVNIVMPGGQIQVNRSTHNGAIFIHHSSRAEFVFQGEFVLNYYKYDSK